MCDLHHSLPLRQPMPEGHHNGKFTRSTQPKTKHILLSSIEKNREYPSCLLMGPRWLKFILSYPPRNLKMKISGYYQNNLFCINSGWHVLNRKNRTHSELLFGRLDIPDNRTFRVGISIIEIFWYDRMPSFGSRCFKFRFCGFFLLPLNPYGGPGIWKLPGSISQVRKTIRIQKNPTPGSDDWLPRYLSSFFFFF